jgi:beta-glucanase (GH16 family)
MEYKLVWEDDFNVDGPVNPKIWNVEHAGTGFGNNEDQYYTPREKNLYCKDSILHIVAHKENYKHRQYTSAKITSYGKKSVGYGMVEVKAKLPKGKGTWPAIWMLAESIRNGVSWPLCGEIDIMENIGRNHEEVHFSLHSKLYNHVIKTQQTYFETIPGVTERFSVYKMIWEPNYIKFFVDDKEYVTFTKGEDNRDITKLGWPFEPPYFIILNLAIGGNWGGEIDDSIFPQELLIDYVKVYERIDRE